jgi:probable F420-dependent oxidoreductase
LLAPNTTGRIADVGRIARLADRRGYDSVWAGEANSHGVFALAGVVAAQTERVRIGTAIVPIFGRSVAVVAQEAATLQLLSGGRFILGLGMSTPVIVERWRGVKYVRPLAQMREYASVARDALAGERVSVDGDFVHLGGFEIDLEEFPAPPIYLGGFGPKLVGLAAEIAAGLILSVMSPRGVARTVAAYSDAGGDGEIVHRITIVLGDDIEQVRRRARLVLGFYLSNDAYRASLTRQGFGDRIEAFAAKWEAGERREATATIDDEFLHAVGVLFGSDDEIRERLDAYAEAGVDTAILHPIVVADDPEAAWDVLQDGVTRFAPSYRGG